MRLRKLRAVTAGIAGLALVAAVPGPAPAAPATGGGATTATGGGATTAAGGGATTSRIERARVDRVPTPKLGWTPCYDIAECATVSVPLDYDEPTGPTTELGVLRVKAKDQRHRIGSLFLNPGGPGGPATQFALAAPTFLSDAVLERFDIVGVDPRGVGASSNIRCWRTVREQRAVIDGINIAFPWGRAAERKYADAAGSLSRACSTTGRPLSGAMSTAEVARDMDVMRRAVGDDKLSYLGFSYGSALGQYYANMFPDRFRALAVDGVLDPRAWTGRGALGDRLLGERTRSADGAHRALREIFRRCDRAGERYCVFAAGDPVARFEEIVARLRIEPLVFEFPDDPPYVLDYPELIAVMQSVMSEPRAGEYAMSVAAEVWGWLHDGIENDGTTAQAGAAAVTARSWAARAGSDDPPYLNFAEAYSGVICTDGRHPAQAGTWSAAVDRLDRRAPHFGRLWGWSHVQCATENWTVRDEDAYLGPFNRWTAAPVLVVGNFWDPATNYEAAVSASRLLPNARLLSSDNWGHTAYGTGTCVTGVIDDYLLTGALPPRGTLCTAAHQPFTQPLPPPGADAASGAVVSSTGKQLPPVIGPLPAGRR